MSIRVILFFAILAFLFPSPITYSSNSHNYQRCRSKILASLPSNILKNKNIGIYVEYLDTGETIFKLNHRKNFIPASNNKIITSYASLNLIGKSYRFKTSFFSGGGIVDGVVYGGLYIKAYGDPSIDTESIEEMVDSLVSLGIKRIKGDIYLDDTYFDEKKYGVGWKKEWRGDYYCPPVSAFALNYNTIMVEVSPSVLGKPPSVKVQPQGFDVEIVNKARTSRSGVSLDARLDGKDNFLIIEGKIGRRFRPRIFPISVNDPTLYFGKVFRSILKEKGINFEGTIAKAKVPRWAVSFYDHYSKSLSDIVQDFNKNSVNIIGEMLVKTLGAWFMGEPGTWKKGTDVIVGYLHKVGIDNIILVDGSGLSKHNRISPYALVRVLARAYKNPSISKEFLSSLPIAGVDGTLKKRFRFSKIRRRVFAKTGYLNGVRALSGYVKTTSGDILAFSIISNGLGWRARAFQEELLSSLVDCDM